MSQASRFSDGVDVRQHRLRALARAFASALPGASESAPQCGDSNQHRAPTRPERAASTQAGFASVDRATTGSEGDATESALGAGVEGTFTLARNGELARRTPGMVGRERRGGRHAARGAGRCGHSKKEPPWRPGRQPGVTSHIPPLGRRPPQEGTTGSGPASKSVIVEGYSLGSRRAVALSRVHPPCGESSPTGF
jgi:hypothetical protein